MPSLLKFADVELDLRRYQLRRDGRVLKLERIPMDLLVFLVEQRGRLVTREEIIERIWGQGVFVDTENAINTAVRKIRQALKDDAANPQILETVPGKGYRFVPVVTVIGEEEPGGAVAPGEAQAIRSGAASAPAAVTVKVAPQPVHIPAKRISKKTLFGAGALAVLVAAYFLRPVQPPPQITRVEQLTRSGEAFHHEPLLTDGARVYYLGSVSDAQGKNLRLKQVLLNGNEDTVVPNVPPNLAMLALSPDHTTFLARVPGGEESPVWLLPVSGGAPRRIGEILAHSVSWSHDGRTLA